MEAPRTDLPHHGVSVLVVDDDPAICMAVTLLLEDEGYAVRSAANGAEAVDAVLQQCPQLVLLDMQMPVLDGWGFITQLQARELHPRILVLSAALQIGAWAAEIQADDYLPKPFALVDLLDKVAHLCDKVR